MLIRRKKASESPWVFAVGTAEPMLVSSLDHQHAKVRSALNFPGDFVVHSLRHTFLTRLGESDSNAFEIMKLAGHSSVTVSQRYVHPTPKSLETAMERLDKMNQKARTKTEKPAKEPKVATISATSQKRKTVKH